MKENNNDNTDLLLYNAKFGNLEKVKHLEKKCVSISCTDQFGSTALHKAAHGAHRQVVKYLIMRGAPVDSKVESTKPEQSGATPLTYAVMKGNVEIVRDLIDHGASTDVMLGTLNLLSVAIDSDDPATIDIILGVGFDINQHDSGGRTPLIFALGREKYASLKFLLEQGADYRKCSTSGYLPLFYAVQVNNSNSNNCIRLLLTHVEEKGSKDGLLEYVNGIDVESGRTALHIACRVQNYYSVKILLEHGADCSIRDSYDLYPLHYLIGSSNVCSEIRSLIHSHLQHSPHKS